MRISAAGFSSQPPEGEKRVLNSELWHACAGPLVSLPAVGSRVVYFPQGHSEQVAATTSKEVDAHIPNHPSLPPQLFCQLHNVTMHADNETDEVYAQMTLQPLSPEEQKENYLPADLGLASKQPTNYFCKTLTASDTSTHGGFSVPRRAAEKVFPPLDFSLQPPAQELIAKDLHDNEWKFRHIFRGQPKRHLLTTGWSVFVSAKRLAAGDSVIFIWNEKNQLFLGIRRAIRPQSMMPSSVISSDSMHLGLLAAAAHAAATNSPFTIFYNPRACPSEFVIPLIKYVKAVYHTRISVGMRFRMLFETEDSSVRRYMGTITGICDLDPSRWRNSHWRSVKVGWDESTAGERQPRVSLWEVEPLTTFPMYPSPYSLRMKRPWPPGLPSLQGINVNNFGIDSPLMWLRGDNGEIGMQSLNFPGIGVPPWMQPRFDAPLHGPQNDMQMHQAMAAAALQEARNLDPSKLAPTSHLHFQQAPNQFSHSVSLAQPQMLQQSQSQQGFIQSAHGYQNNSQSKCNAEVQTTPNSIQQLLQHQQSFSNQRLEPQQLEQLVDNSQIVTDISQVTRSASHIRSQSTSQAIPSLGHQHSFSGSSGNPVTSPMVSPLQSLLSSFDESSHQLHLPRANPMISSSDWPPSKRAAVEPYHPSGAPHSIPQLHQFAMPQSTFSHNNTVTLPPLPGRDCSVDQEGDSQLQSHISFTGQVDASSLYIQNQPSSIMRVRNNENSTSTPHSASQYFAGAENNFASNTSLMPPPSCIEESGFLQSAQNVEQNEIPDGTFVKVYKSGSFGRSLDISKFSGYHELRSELAHMFGLQGQLEDPVRSGWQLVFVDRENDSLLLGDDPWQEFVNSVWCIKILSPQEVQQMGKQGIDPRNSVQVQSLYNNGCDDYTGQQGTKNLSNGIAVVGSLDY